MPHYHIDDDINKVQGVDINLDWLIMNYLCEPINDDKYQVIAVPLPICQN